ncbi:MAG TPA: ABC transporter substrate-binding protein [Candidatus Binatia bacterium]|jgi:ABC-type nitrate/sulfonate/bicarbonate transport system substrate-binding protein|nr:ABC transporter substrate-binding protein [Candidatus Binatia bacterium]
MGRKASLGAFLLLAPLAAAIASQTVSAAEKSAKLVTVRIGYVSRSILDMPYIIARDRGFFREEGLEPELIFMRAAQTVPAMLAGGIDFGTATGTAIAAAVSGVDVRLIFALTDRPSFDLIAVPSITSVQQLRGKKLGTSGVGSLAEILARQILIANKIPLEQVTFLPFGTSDITYVALKAGTIDATMLQIPQKFFAVDEGFRNLASGADVYRAVMGGLTTTKATITDRPELINKTIRATMRAVRLIKTDKNYTLGFMKGPHLDLSGERARFAERVYDATLQLYLSSHTVDETLQREMIAIASQRVKPAQPVPPERVFDFSFTQKVILPK